MSEKLVATKDFVVEGAGEVKKGTFVHVYHNDGKGGEGWVQSPLTLQPIPASKVKAARSSEHLVEVSDDF